MSPRHEHEMSDRLAPMPQGLRFTLNMRLGDRDLEMIDDNARFIVRDLVADAYGQGFNDGYIAGLNDEQTDRDIKREAQRVEAAQADRPTETKEN